MPQARALTSAVILLALAVTVAPGRGETQSKLPVSVIPTIAGLESIDRAVFSPDGKLVATLDGAWWSRIKLWEVASGRLLRTLTYQAYFNAAVFSPDGKWLASAHKDGKIKLWDVTTGAITATLQARPQPKRDEDVAAIKSLWIDAKGEFLVSADDNGLMTIWSVAQRKPLRSFEFGKVPEGTNNGVIALRLSADRGKLIAVTQASVKVFDAGSGKESAAFVLPNKYPWWNSKERYEFSKDSIVGDDGLIVRYKSPDCAIEELKFLSLQDGKDLPSIDRPGHCQKPKDNDSYGAPAIFTSASRPDAIIARAGVPEFKQWDPKTRQVTRVIQWPDATGAELIGIDRDFKLAMSQNADKVGIRELASGSSVRDLASPAQPARRVNVIAAKDGRTILLSHLPSSSAQRQKALVLWPLDALSPKSVPLAADDETAIHDFAPGPKLALASNKNNEIVLYSIETGGEQRRFSVPGIKEIWKARLSPDGKFVAVVGSDANDKAAAVLLDAGDGALKHRFAGRDQRNGMMASTGADDESDLVTAVAFSADSRSVAVGRWNGTAEIWSTQSLRRVKLLPASKHDADQIWSLAFSVDGRHLIAGSRNSGVFLWDVAAARVIGTYLYEGLAGHVHVAGVALSHDGRLVAGGLAQHAISTGDAGGEHGIKVWNAATGKLRFTLRGHEKGVGAVAFSSDDRWIVSASYDGTVRYWDSKTGQWAATFMLASDGRWLVVTESGMFAGSPDSDALLNVVRGFTALPVAHFRDRLYRPALVEQLLTGDRERRYRAAARQLNLQKLWDARPSP